MQSVLRDFKAEFDKLVEDFREFKEHCELDQKVQLFVLYICKKYSETLVSCVSWDENWWRAGGLALPQLFCRRVQQELRLPDRQLQSGAHG